jgi:hypothetical protein
MGEGMCGEWLCPRKFQTPMKMIFASKIIMFE